MTTTAASETHRSDHDALLAIAERRSDTGPVFVAFILLLGILALAGLTGLGASRRGMDALPMLVAAVFFPVTWVVWYLRDEHPYRREHPVARACSARH